MKYRWRNRSFGVAAEVAAKELEKIRKKKGGILETKVVVDEARNPSSPIHPAFEWDDSLAGEQYRQYQARNMIRSLRIEIEESELSVPMFLHIEVGDVPHYNRSDLVVRSVDEWDSAVEHYGAKLNSARQAFDDLATIASHSNGRMKTKRKKVLKESLSHLERAQQAAQAL